MKERKGISLIVLIVTIIVMIIIAGAIIISLSEVNIIDRAENATSDYNLKVEKEKIQLALNEWLLEKNTSAAPKTFKEFMEDALPDDTISGADNGPIIITIKDTKNKYSVTENGNITLQNGSETQTTALEKYLFGEDLSGREVMSLLSESEGSYIGMDFIDDTSTEINERDALEIVGMQNEDEIEIIKETETETMMAGAYIIVDSSDTNNVIIYNLWIITYINSETGEEWIKTYPEYGLVKVAETSQFEDTYVGKTVRYDDKLWTIIYDDEINGLQMICNESQLYNGENFSLDSNLSSITDWNAVLTEADLDNSGDLTDFEKAAYSYNNAIDILNAACKSLVSTNANILDVRCVGSDPVNKDLENETLYTSERLAQWPIPENEVSSEYSTGFANDKLKSGDTNYKADIERMMILNAMGIYGDSTIIEDNSFWLASRFITDNSDSSYVDFHIYCNISHMPSLFRDGNGIIAISIQGFSEPLNNDSKLLPVVKLNPEIQFSGVGTVDSPYTF